MYIIVSLPRIQVHVHVLYYYHNYYHGIIQLLISFIVHGHYNHAGEIIHSISNAWLLNVCLIHDFNR